MTDSWSYLSRRKPKSTIDTLEIGIRTPQVAGKGRGSRTSSGNYPGEQSSELCSQRHPWLRKLIQNRDNTLYSHPLPLAPRPEPTVFPRKMEVFSGYYCYTCSTIGVVTNAVEVPIKSHFFANGGIRNG